MMNLTIILIAVLAVIVILGAFLKIFTRRKLKDIDGLGGVVTKEEREDDDNIIML